MVDVAIYQDKFAQVEEYHTIFFVSTSGRGVFLCLEKLAESLGFGNALPQILVLSESRGAPAAPTSG